MGGRPMRLHRINAVIMRHLYLFPRTLERWAESIYWPVLDLIVWGLTSRWVESAGNDVPQLALIVLTGVVFWQVVWRANYEISVNLLEEFWNQNMVNLFATPLTVWEWSVGLVVLGLLKNLLTLLVGAGAVWLLYRLNIFAVGWIILPFLFSLLISGWFMGFAASGVIIYYGRGSRAWPGWPASPWPPSAPSIIRSTPCRAGPGSISAALPMTYIFEGMRKILRGAPMPLSDLLDQLRPEHPLPRPLHPLLRTGCSTAAATAAWAGWIEGRREPGATSWPLASPSRTLPTTLGSVRPTPLTGTESASFACEEINPNGPKFLSHRNLHHS